MYQFQAKPYRCYRRVAPVVVHINLGCAPQSDACFHLFGSTLAEYLNQI